MKARKKIRDRKVKHEELLRSYSLANSNLQTIHKKLERKATEIINQQRTNKTDADKLRRILEVCYGQLKTVSIKISKEAGYFILMLIL